MIGRTAPKRTLLWNLVQFFEYTDELLPDAFAFLAWELKENWRLYRANRPSSLRPVALGSHGETVRQLLTEW